MSDPPNREAAIFEDALSLPPEQRAAHLEKVCGDDDRFRQRIEKLLQAHDKAGNFMEEPVAPTADKTGFSLPPTEKTGDKIGHYKLLQQIGEGGCGVVYMAEQEEPVRRRVALKVIKLGMDTKSVIARFEAERQALALMDHPNIAKVLDAGATATGRPYFVMELVGGIKITDYCDQNNLPTKARLELFTQICRAIQHAHQKGIIHRDIKPSNILVALHDGLPIPKVIDFGIAKATGQRLTDKTLFTAFEQFIGTPAYMSPEQAERGGLDVDTRSDIYALGVLLYELLTGQPPFDPKELLAAGLDEMCRTIREKEPDRPSTRLGTMLDAELTTVARQRQIEPPKLVHLLRGDLDWIVMKALEKDRTRRYETASGLATDIQHHLNNEPVAACPPSNLYRFQKLVRRNKLAFAATSAVIAALILGLGVSTWMFFGEKKARERAMAAERTAQTEATKSQQVARFLKDMLAGVGPSAALGRDTTMLRDILDKTTERVDQDLKDEPEVQAELLDTLGLTYIDLVEYAKAEAVQRKALGIRQKLFGNKHPDVARSLDNLVLVLERQRRLTEAETLAREALEMQKELLGGENQDIAASMDHLANIFFSQGNWSGAETMHRQALAIKRKLSGNDKDSGLAWSLNNLARVLWTEGKLDEAETLNREALAIRKKLYGYEHPEVALSLRELGLVLNSQGKTAEAEPLVREALAMQRKILGDKHFEVAISLESLVTVLQRQGKLDEAASVCREAAENGDTKSQYALGRMYADGRGVSKDETEADKWYRKAAEQYRRTAEQGDAVDQYNLGWMYANGKGVAEDATEAVKWYRKSADQGNIGAQEQIARMYASGEVFPRTKPKLTSGIAKRWSNIARRQRTGTLGL